MKKILSIVLMLLGALAAFSDTPQKDYIARYSAIAVSEMHRSGIPASITLAQGILESRSGLSSLAVEGNNHFGIKCHRNWKGRTMRVNDDAPNECFRVYKTAEESFRDHSDFLRYQDRYKSLFELKITDYKGWARGLKKAGYATDPAYAGKLIKIIEDYDLARFDSGVSQSEVPQTPLKIEKASQVQVQNPVKRQGQVRESYSFRMDRKVYKKNGVLCVYAEPGDTFESIALEFNLFRKELLRFNDLRAERPLKRGEVIYIKAKKKHAVLGMPMYVAGDKPETLWEISQRFGVRMKSILKFNSGITADYVPAEGDVIYLKKIK